VPALHLEEHPDAGATIGRAVVHGDGRVDIGRIDHDSGLLQRLAYDGVNDGLVFHMSRRSLGSSELSVQVVSGGARERTGALECGLL
jgi:hypothetical protein